LIDDNDKYKKRKNYGIMATVYKIEIETVSAWTNYEPKELEKKIKQFLEEQDSLCMESTKIKVVRK
tara:strand:- start:146 stop:343 length:198 start_codon:yes stop_codon:yes gene_type:complete